MGFEFLMRTGANLVPDLKIIDISIFQNFLIIMLIKSVEVL